MAVRFKQLLYVLYAVIPITLVFYGVFGQHSSSDVILGDTTMPHFPEVSGRNIDGESHNLPHDFAGEYNIVLMPFNQVQQIQVNTWIPILRDLELANDAIRTYEVPTLPEYSVIEQMQIDFWMSNGIPDPLARETTITLYTDVDAMQTALGFGDTTVMRIYMVNLAGEVYWEGEGAFNEEQWNRLLSTIAELTDRDNS